MKKTKVDNERGETTDKGGIVNMLYSNNRIIPFMKVEETVLFMK
jgi:hypothetical protein